MACQNEPKVDSERVQFMCDICDSKFESKIILNEHINSDHIRNKPFKSDICDYSCSIKV